MRVAPKERAKAKADADAKAAADAEAKANADAKDFAIIFVSSDRSKDAQMEYLKKYKMPRNWSFPSLFIINIQVVVRTEIVLLNILRKFFVNMII